MTRPNPPFALCANGRRIYVDPSDERGMALVRSNGTFNPLAVATWQNLLDERLWTHVVDVGANYGEMLVGVRLPRSATTIALEPNPQVVPYLARSAAEAAITVEIIAKAASLRPGAATLTVDRTWSGLSSIAGAQPESQGHVLETIEVPALTLASLIG